MEMKTKIELTINEIQNSNEAALQLCSSIMAIHKDQKNLKPHQCDRDIYTEEQLFVYQAYVQTEVQRELGTEIIRYLEYVESLEKEKLVLVKEVIGSYLEGIKEDHEDEAQLNLLQDILGKDTENKYIEECYSSDELFTKELIRELSKHQLAHQKQVNLKFIKHFLSRLEYHFFGHLNYLVLKEYHIFLKLGTELEAVTIVVTVDGFLNLYFAKRAITVSDNTQDLLLDSFDYSAKIDHSLTMTRNGDIALEIDCKKSTKNAEALLAEKTVTLVFSSEDQREEFSEFVSRILN
jgi:hypothetical protein